MKQITSFNIDSSDLKATISSRYLTILGDAGSKFVLYISNEDLKYYNFETNVFATAETKITAEIPNSGTYTKEITFPVVTDDDQYDFKLLVNPHYEVELSEGLSPKNPVLYTTSIAQKIDSVVTFAVATTTSGTTEFQAMPDNVTLTKPPLSTDTHDISISWTIKATDAVAGGALVIDRQILDTDFKFTITPESIGAGSAGTVIYLNSVENLIKGMSLITIESETLSGSPVISSINKTAKSVTVSVAQDWETEKDITFKGGGQADISRAIGANMVFSDMSVALTPFTAVLSDAVTNDQTIDCVNGFGIKVGANYTGIGVNNAVGTPPHVQVVTGITYSGNTFETTDVQTLQDKTILTFTGCSQEAVIKARIKVTKIPKDNLILTLDLDSLLTSNPT